MNMMRIPLALLLAGVFGVAGCVAHQPVSLYRLDSGAALPTRKDGPLVVLEPRLADYLQREDLLQRQPDGSLLPSSQERWAGSFGADVEQVLLRQLAWRLDTQRLLLQPASAGVAADAQVRLHISRLDSGPQQPAVLEGEWLLLDRRGQLRDSSLIRLQEEHNGAAADQVRAQSQLLQDLAGQLAGSLQAMLKEEPAKEAPRKRAPARPSNKPQQDAGVPQIPRASPIRTDVEVYRF